jgi:hypothetical protein
MQEMASQELRTSPQSRKKTLPENWRQLSAVRKMELIFLGVAGLAALGYLIAYIVVSVIQGLHTASPQDIASQRAYVSFGGFGNAIVNTSPTGQVWGYVFPLLRTNSGSTPTVNGKMQVGHRMSTEDLPANFAYPLDSPVSDFHIEPKGGTAWDYDIPVGDLIAIQNHTSRYFIWGTEIYRDVFFPKTP